MVEDYERYQARQRALVMLKLMVQGERDLDACRVGPQEQVFADLGRRLEAGDTARQPARRNPVLPSGDHGDRSHRDAYRNALERLAIGVEHDRG